MKRYSMFNQVHKGLRALMYETALNLQQTDFNNPAQADALLSQIELVTELFDKHADSEDGKVFSAIAQYEPLLVNALEAEHVKDHALGEQLRKAVTYFDHDVSNEEKEEAGRLLNNAFVEFMVFNIEHMAKEEDKVSKALWKHYTDAELHQITVKIIADIPPQMMQQYSKWFIRGMSNNEIISWLKQVKNEAPDFVFQGLMQTAASELSTQRWLAVQEELTEGVMVI